MVLEAVVAQTDKIQGIKGTGCHPWDWKGTLNCWGLKVRTAILGFHE